MGTGSEQVKWWNETANKLVPFNQKLLEGSSSVFKPDIAVIWRGELQTKYFDEKFIRIKSQSSSLHKETF